MNTEKRIEIERVLLVIENSANGHDELDGHVLEACGAQKTPHGRWHIGNAAGVRLAADMARVTQSVDASLSLCEEVLPRWDFKLLRCDATLWTGTDTVLQGRAAEHIAVMAYAATLPLAICAAILKARLALADATPPT